MNTIHLSGTGTTRQTLRYACICSCGVFVRGLEQRFLRRSGDYSLMLLHRIALTAQRGALQVRRKARPDYYAVLRVSHIATEGGKSVCLYVLSVWLARSAAQGFDFKETDTFNDKQSQTAERKTGDGRGPGDHSSEAG